MIEPKRKCPYFDSCQIFDRFKLEGMANIWINLYCKGFRQERCARKRERESSGFVPDSLLPDGTQLPKSCQRSSGH